MSTDPSVDPRQTVDYPKPPAEPGTVDETGAYDAAPPTASAAKPAPPGDWPTIAGYEITAEIAKGGMGRVFVGREISLDREIAVKTLLPGGDAERFVTESKITARLPHPGIPPVHALGALADGSQYLVMKLIRGRTLAALLKERKSPSDDLSRWVQVFEQIAQAAGFAHAQGIIHRDLKPANVMVGAFGEVQVMDWGLAKDLQSRERKRPDAPHEAAAPQPEMTQAGTILGTAGYMSPEQARGETVDARADVFALGAILTVILTGKPPFVGKSSRELLDQAAAGALTDAFTRLDGCGADKELIDLAMRCLAANVPDRPADARMIAEQIAAYRAGVEARLRQAETERAAALVREGEQRKRRRQFVIAAALVVLVLASGIIGTSFGMLSASNEAYEKDQALLRETGALKREKDRADGEAKAAAAEKLANIKERAATKKERAASAVALTRLTEYQKTNALMESIFTDINPRLEKKGGPLLLEQLRNRLFATADKLDEEAIGDPLTVARLQNFLGSTLLSLGKADKAIELHVKALGRREKLLGPDHPDTLTSMNNLAWSYQEAGKLSPALLLFEETLKLREAKLGADHPDALISMSNLAGSYRAADRLEMALPLYEKTLKLMKDKFGPDDPETLRCMNNLALGYLMARQLALAMPLFEEVLDLCKAKLGRHHPYTLATMSNLATAYLDAGKLDLALPLCEETLKLMRVKLGPDHPDTLRSMSHLAKGYLHAGQLDLALPLCEETLKLMRVKLAPDHPDTLTSMSNLAKGYRSAGRLDLALPLYEETLKLRKAQLDPDHSETVASMNNLALGYLDAGKFGLAMPLLEEALKVSKAKLGPDHPDTLTSMNNLAEGYRETGKLHLALPLMEETLKLRKAKLGPDHPDTLTSMSNLALSYHAVGKLSPALLLFEETLKLREAKLGADHPDTLISMSNLAGSYRAADRLELALPLYEKTLKLMRAKLRPNHPGMLTCMGSLAYSYHATGKLDLALPLYEETLKLMKAKPGPDHPDTFTSMGNLAKAYLDSKQPKRALPLLDDLVAERRRRLGARDPRFAGFLAQIGLELLKAQQFPEAETMLREASTIRDEKEPNVWTTFNTKVMLGTSLLGQKKYQDAEPLLKDGYEGMKQRERRIPLPGKVRLPEAAQRLVKLYEATDRKTEAEKWAKVVTEYRRQDGKLLDAIHDLGKELKLTDKLDAETSALIYQVRLKAGVTYVIDMVSPNGKALDPYLYLRDAKDNILAEDDDSGGGLNARITIRVRADGVYRVCATSFNNGRGAFTLTVRPKD